MGCERSFQDARRQVERHQTESVSCDLGEVIDLSAGGMRLACKGRPPLAPGTIGRLRLRGADGAVTLTARAAWIRRCGFRKYEIGLQFLNMKPRVVAAVEALARYGFFACADQHDASSGRPGPRSRSALSLRASFSLPDYYAVLGVPADADDALIQSAYRRLVRQHHPDVNHTPDAQVRFIEITRAYEVLRDPEQRRQFDLRGAA